MILSIPRVASKIILNIENENNSYNPEVNTFGSTEVILEIPNNDVKSYFSNRLFAKIIEEKPQYLMIDFHTIQYTGIVIYDNKGNINQLFTLN